MFWGLIMEPERRYTQQVKKSFHISMAALDIATSGNEPAQVMCSYEGRNYLLCTLKKPDVVQCNLDLEFAAGSQVSFASNGKAYVHLTGYLTDADEDGLNISDLEEQEEDDVEEEEQVEEKQGKKKKLKKKNEKIEPPSKKAKLQNGIMSEEQEDEEESDDPDFEEEEVETEEGDESGDEEASDEEDEGEEDDSEDEDNEEEQEEIPQKLTKKQKKQAKQQEQQVNGEQKTPKKEQQPKKQKRVLEKGVIVEDLVEGEGPIAKPGKFINVYYEGRLEKTQKMFDATKKGPGFKFRLGSGEVIKAWDIGLAGMKVGGKRKITCPPHTAYGAKGSPPAIPPNSTLVFTVELKKVN